MVKSGIFWITGSYSWNVKYWSCKIRKSPDFFPWRYWRLFKCCVYFVQQFIYNTLYLISVCPVGCSLGKNKKECVGVQLCFGKQSKWIQGWKKKILFWISMINEFYRSEGWGSRNRNRTGFFFFYYYKKMSRKCERMCVQMLEWIENIYKKRMVIVNYSLRIGKKWMEEKKLKDLNMMDNIIWDP